jgi:2,3-bisphosphoglycerate-independent phosphoglycerate mutase
MTLVRNGRRGNLIKDEKTNIWSIIDRTTNRIVTSGEEQLIKKLFLKYENYQLNVAK